MTEPLEGAMLPNNPRHDTPPPTWPDLAYWRDLANHREAMLAIRAGEIDALRLELEMMRRLICSPAPPSTDTTRSESAETKPTPEREQANAAVQRLVKTPPSKPPEIWR